MFFLTEKLFYHTYGEYTYVKSLETQEEFLFGSVVGDVLDFFKRHPGATLDALTGHMEQLYDTHDLRADMAECLELLDGCHLLTQPQEGGQPMEITAADRISEYCTRNCQLYNASLELTYRCTERCIHCYLGEHAGDDTRRELTTQEWKNVLDQLAELGCLRVLLTGGEISLRRDLVELARYAVEKGFLLDLYTNGVTMTDEQFDALSDLPINSMSFSLYAADAAVHDAITRVPGSFRKTMNQIFRVRAAGIPTYVKTVTIQQNRGQLEKLMALGRKYGFEVQNTMIISPIRDETVVRDCRVHSAEEYHRCFELQHRHQPQFLGVQEVDLDEPVCGIGRNMLSVDPYGDVHACIALPLSLGNVCKDALKDIWTSNQTMEWVRSITFRDLKCDHENCGNRDFCTVCVGTVYEEGQGELRPSPETCLIAQGRRAFLRDHLENGK